MLSFDILSAAKAFLAGYLGFKAVNLFMLKDVLDFDFH
jgi:hypothetical protein